jgi:glycosyltransferase involved in cell wall biosynthesis
MRYRTDYGPPLVRVLYLNPFSQEVSGPDESLRALLGALIPAGVEAHVVLPAPGPQVARYQALGAAVCYARLAIVRRGLGRGAALFPPRLARAAAEVALLARRLRADLIHTNVETLLEGGLAARLLRIPHVLHYRGNTLDEPRRVYDALTAIWAASSDHIYCISRATAAVFERRGRARKVEVLYNPIDLSAFARASRSAEVRAELGAAAGTRLVGTVGRIHPRKDLETFVRAAALVAARDPEVRFVIVGAAEVPAEHAYRQQLEELVRASGLGGRLRFAGARRDVAAVMKALDVFVLASRHEGFGRVVAEAMAAERPVVVTREGAPPELVEEGRYGLCAAPADAADFAGQILRLLAERDMAEAMAGRAVARARGFDAGAAAARVLDRYRTLVAGRRR